MDSPLPEVVSHLRLVVLESLVLAAQSIRSRLCFPILARSLDGARDSGTAGARCVSPAPLT
jgi:hypothetical protein